VEVLGGVHERGVFEVFLPCPVDVSCGFLAELIDVRSVDAVLADEEQALLYGSVCRFQRFRGLALFARCSAWTSSGLARYSIGTWWRSISGASFAAWARSSSARVAATALNRQNGQGAPEAKKHGRPAPVLGTGLHRLKRCGQSSATASPSGDF